MNIAEIIKDLRLKSGVGQSVLAGVAGFKNRANISKLESGRLEWKFRDVVKVLNFLGYEIVIQARGQDDGAK